MMRCLCTVNCIIKLKIMEKEAGNYPILGKDNGDESYKKIDLKEES